MSEAHRNAARQIPGAAMVFLQDRTVIGAVAEDADARHFLSGVVPHRRADAKQTLQRVRLDRRRAEANDRGFGFRELGRRRETQATQAPRRLARREVDRAVARHFFSVDRAHGDFVGTGAPHVGHFATRGDGNEAAIRRAQHVLTHDRVGVQAQLRLSQRAEAEVEHLERQSVALGLIVLADVSALLQHGEQPMNGRSRLPQCPREVRQTHPARHSAQDLAHLERLVDGGH